MRTNKMAESYLFQAEARLMDASKAVKEGNHPYAVRLAQESHELSLKAILRLAGIEYPKAHDVGIALLAEKERFPKWLRQRIPRLKEASKALAKDRGPAMYGDEERGIPPTELFTKEHAQEAVKEAEYAFKTIKRFYQEFISPIKRGEGKS